MLGGGGEKAADREAKGQRRGQSCLSAETHLRLRTDLRREEGAALGFPDTLLQEELPRLAAREGKALLGHPGWLEADCQKKKTFLQKKQQNIASSVHWAEVVPPVSRFEKGEAQHPAPAGAAVCVSGSTRGSL